ncbi:hypothetical protein NIES2107_51640 [Nostoc carneum NIES-2107]|nr:hypothetical protein NIES2107_51640 [Nostoc carneum NIES-2107]
MKTDSIFYQLFQNFPEVLLETVPRLLALGLTVEKVAEVLGLSLEQVQQVATKQ